MLPCALTVREAIAAGHDEEMTTRPLDRPSARVILLDGTGSVLLLLIEAVRAVCSIWSSRPEEEPTGRVDLGHPAEVFELCLKFIGLVHDLDDVVLTTVIESSDVPVGLVLQDVGVLDARQESRVIVVVDQKHAATGRETRPHHPPEGSTPLARDV